ncbi:MAG TPA: VanZ family protein [Candidatus Blautia excrementipullorum]|nr:VanZ family protein [Candidatus Blautia excrementipullorum]
MNLFLAILLIVVGYFICFVLAAARLNTGTSITTLALAILLIYGCIIGMFVLAARYSATMGILLYSVSIIYSLAYWMRKGCHFIQRRHKIHWGPFLTLLAYILAIFYLTLITRENGTELRIQMNVLNWLNQPAQSGNISTFHHMFSNFVMFVPLGVIFPFITGNAEKKFIVSTSFGMLLSVAIETGQLIFHSGLCDIDDILANTLGAAAGAFLVVIYLKLSRKSRS